MDVRKPHAAHSWREFAVEIGTITIGILIALSLEALVQAVHDQEVVGKARAQLSAELTRNRKRVVDAVTSAKAQEPQLKTLILYGQDRLSHRPHPFPSDANLNGSFTTLSTSAWESTVATQALVHMPFDEANALANAYTATRGFNEIDERAEARWFELAGIGADYKHLSDADVAKALSELRVAFSYQTAIEDAGRQVIAGYDKALAKLKS